MSDSLERLRSKISRGRQLGSVVHAMKSMAAVRISQFEQATRSLDRYMRNVRLGLSVCLRSAPILPEVERQAPQVGAVVFGSDEGLVGRFNETVLEHAQSVLPSGGKGARVWLVGERLAAAFAEHAVAYEEVLAVPGSVEAISPLVAELLGHLERWRGGHPASAVYLLFNRFAGGDSFEPVHERLLPFGARWARTLAEIEWPTQNLPEPVGTTQGLLEALMREYLFGSLFRACAESIASENASRLAAMQRAERNIDSLVASLELTRNGLRQAAIDEELFDVISGFEALTAERALKPGDARA